MITDTAKSNEFIKFGLQTLLLAEKVSIFHSLTVKEVLWGYNDTLLVFLQKMEDSPQVKQFLDYLKKHDPALAAKIPNLNPFIQLQVGNQSVLIKASLYFKLKIQEDQKTWIAIAYSKEINCIE